MIKQKFRAELLDKNGVKKCDLEITGGAINCSSKLSIKRGGNVTFKYPDAYYIEYRGSFSNPTHKVIKSSSGVKYLVGIDSTGVLYTQPTNTENNLYTGRIKIDDNGILIVDDATSSKTLEFELINDEGIKWGVYVDGIQIIESRTDEELENYFTKKYTEIEWLTDRIKIYYNDSPLGVYMMISPTRNGLFITTDLMDLNILIQRKRQSKPTVFQKGTSYTELLQFFIIDARQTKFIIGPTAEVLPSDIVIDNTKNNLEWFNYIAEQINYTQLTVDNNGYFVSKKYVKPSPSIVDHTYRVDRNSVIIGGFNVSQDLWNTPNVIQCVLALPSRPIMKSEARNDNPSDKFSTYNLGEILEVVEVDNISSQQELDLLASKLLFERRQIDQVVRFNTLINPEHTISNSIQLYSPEIEGVFIESEWDIPLVDGYSMSHTVSKLIDITEVKI